MKKVVILFLALILTSSSAIALEIKSSELSENNSENYHLIENVPYSAKEEGFSCDYAPLEMVYRYYGINTTKIEIFYSAGGGYSQGYGFSLKRALSFPVRKPPVKFLCLGDLTVGGVEDYKFLANLYGCSYDIYDYTFVKNKEKCWREYWEKLQSFVKEDIPAMTVVDPLSWPPYRELTNTSAQPSIFARSCCVIVVVGFNLTNNTICFHDQYVGYKNASRKGMYQWIDIDTLKVAAGRAIWEMKETRYQISLIKKITEPLPIDLKNELIHERNIKKMNGLKDAYDSEFIQNNHEMYGINALKLFKKDIESDLINRLPFYKAFNLLIPSLGYPFNKMIDYFRWESLNKLQIAEYMRLNENISEIYYEDILLLEMESIYWRNLANQTQDLKDAVINSSFYKIKKDSKPIIQSMVETITNIIQTEEIILLNNE